MTEKQLVTLERSDNSCLTEKILVLNASVLIRLLFYVPAATTAFVTSHESIIHTYLH